MANCNILSTINKRKFYLVSIDGRYDDSGYYELFPTYEDCENYLNDLDFSFSATIYEYNLSLKDFNLINRSVEEFLKNLYKFHSSSVLVATL